MRSVRCSTHPGCQRAPPRPTYHHSLTRFTEFVGGDTAIASVGIEDVEANLNPRHAQRYPADIVRRTAEGLSGREITHCRKRYVAREVHRALTRPTPIGPRSAELRHLRQTPWPTTPVRIGPDARRWSAGSR